MMIHLVDQDTKETFQCYGDNEVKAAIAAARASGKIVNMELDDNRRDCLIYIVRDKYPATAELPVALTTEAWHSITEIGDLITETVEKITTLLEPFTIASQRLLNSTESAEHRRKSRKKSSTQRTR